MRKKKVLILSVGKIYGGAEKYTLSLIDNLPSIRYEVHVAIRRDGGLISKIDNVNKLCLDLKKNSLLADVKRLKEYVEENAIEILHCNGINAMFLVMFLPRRIRRIAVIHGDAYMDRLGCGVIKERLFPQLEVFLINRFDQCVAVSQSLENILVARGVKPKKIKVIYNGIDFYDYEKYADGNDKILRICTVGNLLPVKNQMILLKALNDIKNNSPEIEFRCDIYGIGKCQIELQEYITNNNLKEVQLKGFDDKVRKKLNQYHIYIQPSKYESFGLAVLEALNAGCYVIASDVGGVREIIKNAQNRGKLVRVDDYCVIAETIKELYDNRDLIQLDREESVEQLKYVFSVRSMMDALEKIYLGDYCEN